MMNESKNAPDVVGSSLMKPKIIIADGVIPQRVAAWKRCTVITRKLKRIKSHSMLFLNIIRFEIMDINKWGLDCMIVFQDKTISNRNTKPPYA